MCLLLVELNYRETRERDFLKNSARSAPYSSVVDERGISDQRSTWRGSNRNKESAEESTVASSRVDHIWSTSFRETYYNTV